jgi:uncharacterized membrane protein YdcZ (DUF606 family)
MSIALLVPLLLGVVAVFQATLNRHIAQAWGIALALLLNAGVVIVLGLGLLAYCAQRGADTGFLRVNFDPSAVRAWWLLPGCFGFAIVLGMPWAVARLGALPMFVSLVAAQVVTSAAWDHLVEGIPFSAPRMLGAALAIASVLLVSWK